MGGACGSQVGPVSPPLRLGQDVSPNMAKAVVHGGIVYISGQTDDKSAEDITGQTKGAAKSPARAQ